jgi:ParB-like chromosome segregation protein Spo0J
VKKKAVKKVARKPQQMKVVNDGGEMWPVSKLKPHPYADEVFGIPPDHEVKELAQSLKHDGQRDALEVLADGTIVDGRTRLLSAIEAGITELRVIVRHDLKDLKAIKERILRANLMRHHFDKLVAARIYTELKKLARGRSKKAANGEGELRNRLAKRFNLSGRTLDRLETMLDTPTQVQQVYREGSLLDQDMLGVAALSEELKGELVAQLEKGGAAKEKIIKGFLDEHKPTPKPGKSPKKPSRKNANAETQTPKDGQGGGETIGEEVDDEGHAENAGDDAAADDDDGVVVIMDEAAEVDEDDATAVVETDVTVVPVEAGTEAEDDDPVEVYHAILTELPDALDALVEKIDDIAGQAMEPEAAMEALGRIAIKIEILREAEEALAGVPA